MSSQLLGETMSQDFSMHMPQNQRPIDIAYTRDLEAYWDASLGSTADKLRNASKFIPRADFIRLLVFHELFRKVLRVPGAIVECGVHLGGGLMAWAQLSTIYEPMNHTRRIIGFDTFAGFPALGGEDACEENKDARPGGLAAPAMQDLEACIEIYDRTRPLNHIPRVQLVAGDATQTIPNYLDAHRHTVVALLHLDFDIYAPTRTAIDALVKRMPRGGVIVFDELNHPQWPGETLAVMDTLGLNNLRLRRFPHQPQISYAVLGES